MNNYDSQRMSDALVAKNHLPVITAEDADIIILNTCSIREKADEKLFSDLGRIRLLKEERPRITVVTGCVAQLRSNDIVKRMPWVDIILGPQDIQLLIEKLENVSATCDTQFSIKQNAKDKFEKLSDKFSERAVSEFLTIQEGCDNFCTYCVVPYTRGREFSRSVDEIIREAKKLIEFGVVEITLLGQNVNSYHGEGSDGAQQNFSQLLWRFAELDGLKRLRSTTSHPKDIDEDVARAHRDIPILMPFLHLPVQSGSDKILNKMNRKYTAAQYLEKIAMLRQYRPDIALSSDFIVGFPGESEEDFQQTLALVRRVNFAQAYSFKYSPRPKTAAARMPNQITESEKERHLAILQKLLSEQQQKFNGGFLGQELDVLLTKQGRHENQLVGRSPYAQAVTISLDREDQVNIGDVVRAKICEIASHSLMGVL